MNDLNKSDKLFDYLVQDRNQPNFSKHPVNQGESEQDQVQLPISEEDPDSAGSLGTQENFNEGELRMFELKKSMGSPSFTKEYMSPTDNQIQRYPSAKEQFNNTINGNSHQRLLEIEEKRK